MTGALPPILFRKRGNGEGSAFCKIIIGSFMVYQELFETNLLHMFPHSETPHWFSIIASFL